MRVDDTNGARTMIFDRSEAKSAFTADVARKFLAALGELMPEAFGTVMITGDDNAFSANGDIWVMAERDKTARRVYEHIHGTPGHVAEAIFTAPVPVVARVNGDAVGTGTSVVATCDFACATHDARFGASFVNVGLVSDVGATMTLPRLVGLRAAKELAFTGRFVSAERATELDFANEAVTAVELDVIVDEAVETLAV